MTTMTFGKWKGVRLDKVPTAYLRWVMRECKSISHKLRDVIRDELASRPEQPDAEYAAVVHWCALSPAVFSAN